MAANEVTKKLLIYHTLYRLNVSFSNVVRQCTTLQEVGIFSPKDTRLYQGLTQELQCEINERLLDMMHDIEFADWGHFGEVRKAQEKEIRDPDDVFIHARERKEELRKKLKK